MIGCWDANTSIDSPTITSLPESRCPSVCRTPIVSRGHSCVLLPPRRSERRFLTARLSWRVVPDAGVSNDVGSRPFRHRGRSTSPARCQWDSRARVGFRGVVADVDDARYLGEAKFLYRWTSSTPRDLYSTTALPYPASPRSRAQVALPFQRKPGSVYRPLGGVY